ncbi:MAG: 50S ribosomal protein L21 [Anaerolineales bacterium]|nr:50S ribosomal protein L21 [Anaerolineales bacterium]
MKYAIVESGGKQFKAVEGEAIDVDRLPGQPGEDWALDKVLMFVDGETVSVGKPNISGMVVHASIVEHFRGDKVVAFRYSPKKRIRVRRGQRHEYTRLMVAGIGGAKPEKKAAQAAPQPEVGAEAMDDLVRIEGVGAKAAQALRAAGVVTFAQLAETGLEDVQAILHEAGLHMNPETWAEQAKLAAAGDWKAFETLQKKLIGGRKAAPARKN